MLEPTLIICIPSYGRLPKALRTVRALLPQLQLGRVHLMVVDNASSEDYASAFAADRKLSEALQSGAVAVLRNAANIGMSANFMRAFELAAGEWLWLVSDDDDIGPDAVQRLLGAIERDGSRHGFIKFSSARSRPRGGREELESLEAFIDFNARSAHDFNGFIFISNGIYRLRDFRPLLGVGHHHAHTFVPHFMMLTAYMAQGKRMVVLDEEIVNYVVPEVGYSYGMVAGLGVGAPKHMLLKLDDAYYRRFLALFFPHNDYKVVIDLYFHCKRDATLSVCAHLVGDYLRYVGVARRPWRLLPLRCFAALMRFPRLFEWAIACLEARSGLLRKHIDEIRKRYAPARVSGPAA